MGYALLINGVYWGYNPLPNLLLTSWDIQGHPSISFCEHLGGFSCFFFFFFRGCLGVIQATHLSNETTRVIYGIRGIILSSHVGTIRSRFEDPY